MQRSRERRSLWLCVRVMCLHRGERRAVAGGGIPMCDGNRTLHARGIDALSEDGFAQDMCSSKFNPVFSGEYLERGWCDCRVGADGNIHEREKRKEADGSVFRSKCIKIWR